MKKKRISWLLILSMICMLFGQYLSGPVVKAANETSYTVELNETTDLLLSNATGSTGPVTLTYTVESLSATSGNNGVVATPSPLGTNPYSSGKLNYHNTKNRMLEEGKTYTLELSVDASGAVTKTCSWTNASAGTSGTSIDLPHNTGSGSTNSQYFGIYVSGATTAKLTNVTCVDATGKDLGLQVNTKNSDKCTITMNVQENDTEDVTSYTVVLNGTSDMLLSNAKESNGPVTLTYTVESLSATSGNNGVVATNRPLGATPYTVSGNMNFHNTTNRMLVEGRTYTIELSVGDDGKVAWECSWKDADNTGTGITFTQYTDALATGAKHFGIYVYGSTTAKLTNVTCVDAEGKDLGLQVNNSNSDKCIIASEETTSYTVELNGTTDMLLSNATASKGPVTLTYTVESLSATSGNNGVVATNRPLGATPYTVSGNMNFHNTTNRMLVEGRTYTIELSVGDDGKVAWECSWKDADNTGTGITFTQYTDALATGAKHFGIYVYGSTTAKLTNVTCVDATGKDLGLQVNNSNSDKCTIKGNQKVMKVSDIGAYRGDVNSAPNGGTGYIFAGWYQDAACTNAISADTTSGEAYAKFVDETVLTIKAQISAQKSTDPSSDIRFVTTVDSLDYSAIGFEVTANSVSKTYNTTKVYTQLKYIDSDGVMDEYEPDEEFSPISQYFKACKIEGISSKYFDAEWNVRAYWTTLDGTTVYGTPAVKTIADRWSE